MCSEFCCWRTAVRSISTNHQSAPPTPEMLHAVSFGQTIADTNYRLKTRVPITAICLVYFYVAVVLLDIPFLLGLEFFSQYGLLLDFHRFRLTYQKTDLHARFKYMAKMLLFTDSRPLKRNSQILKSYSLIVMNCENCISSFIIRPRHNCIS